MKGVCEVTAYQMKHWHNEKEVCGKWVLARPEGRKELKLRFKLAWKVFTGKADVLTWYKQ